MSEQSPQGPEQAPQQAPQQVQKRRWDTRRCDRTFDYFVLAVLVIVFLAIIEVMARREIKPEVLTVLGASLGVVIAGICQAGSHLWGTPKKPEGGPLPPQQHQQ